MFDKDGSGSISSDEIKEILGFGKAISEEAVLEIIKQVDANGDGEISFEEFSTMMKRLAA
jgi:calcium-dependent protein kinase